MSYKNNTQLQALSLDVLVNALKSCLKTTCPENVEVSENFDLLYLQELFKHKKCSEIYTKTHINITLTDRISALSALVELLDFPPMMKELFKSIKDQINTENLEKDNNTVVKPSGKKRKSGKAQCHLTASSDTCKNQRSLNVDIEQIIEKRSPPKVMKKGPINLAKTTFAKKIDKIQRRNLRDELYKVTVKYPHFSQCKGCTLCETAFKRLNVTYCSKKHGGPACNNLGLYPHATETYLSVLHSTKKFVGITQGFENPMVEDKIVEECATNNDSEMNLDLNSSNASIIDHKIVENSVPNWRSVAPVSEHQQRMLSIADRQMYAKKWKLTSESNDSDYLEALELMTKLKKRYPNYVPPTWATIVSTVLFESMNIDAAKRTAIYHRSRYLSKKAKRIQRAIMRSAKR